MDSFQFCSSAQPMSYLQLRLSPLALIAPYGLVQQLILAPKESRSQPKIQLHLRH